jgi:hypothetical protein
VVFASLPVIFTSASLPWFDESKLSVTDLDWDSIVNGMFLPNWWLILGVLVLAVGFLLPNRWPAVAMGLGGAAGFNVVWLGVFAASAPSNILWAGFVYIASGAVLFAAVGFWAVRARAVPPLFTNRRIPVLAGGALIVVAQILEVGMDRVDLGLIYGLSVLTLAGLVLVPPRISETIRVAALTGFSATAVISVGTVISYFSRFHDEGASITDNNGRIVLDALIAAGMWIALSRPFATGGRE